ncbi:HK97 family phage prohead protease [Enterovirga sp.]|uniref:HK97 family phage prohead protease n=1 Tax=Enterovirga sp. TaxID=2026350 RepID=UPI003FA57D2E
MSERRLPDRARRWSRCETKLLDDPGLILDGDYEFEGYASLFGIPDLGRDVVMRGAFAASLAQRGAAGIRMLWQHDPAEPIGRWLSVAEDRLGLRVRGRLDPGVARAREAASLLRGGAVDGLSIGFRVVEARRERSPPLRRLLRLDLWEISIVTFPMLPGARVEAQPRDGGTPLALAIRRAARRLSPPAAPAASTMRIR